MRAGKPLERDALARESDPAAQRARRPGTARSTAASVARDVLGIARQRDPAERPLALAEQRADVRRHEARDTRTRPRRPPRCACAAHVVAVVERDRAALAAARASRARASTIDAQRARARTRPDRVARSATRLVERQPVRHVAVQRSWRRGLVGDDVGHDAARDELRRAARPRCRRRRSRAPRRRRASLGASASAVVEASVELVEVARRRAAARCARDPPRRPGTTPSFIVDGQRLRAAHPAEPAGDDEPPRERCRRSAARASCGEGLVRPLQDPLRADVDPRARRHLAVHREPARLELAEVLPGRPRAARGCEFAISTRGASGVGPEHADRLARLHEQRLVVLERAQRRDDRVEARASCAPPCRCRRRRPGRRVARRPRGRGCSSASAAPLPGSQPLHESAVPRGARTRRAPAVAAAAPALEPLAFFFMVDMLHSSSWRSLSMSTRRRPNVAPPRSLDLERRRPFERACARGRLSRVDDRALTHEGRDRLDVGAERAVGLHRR